jgi:hypothetical protein
MGENMMKTKRQVRMILEQHHSCCLDDKEDRERILEALFHDWGPIVTYVLGPGLSIACNDTGPYAFIFLDEDEREVTIPVSELDSAWKTLLMKALE